jgi:hypothetical protein
VRELVDEAQRKALHLDTAPSPTHSYLKDPHHAEGLLGYGTFLGKHVKDYENSEQVLRLAVNENPVDRSAHVLHLHAQELADPDWARSGTSRGMRPGQNNEAPPKAIPMGAGPTAYGAMCEPPDPDMAAVGWHERKFPDYGMNIRHGYLSEGAQRYTNILKAEAAGKMVVPAGGIVPKVTVRGKADKLFCNFEDEPSELEAPTGVRRANRVWPAHWYTTGTVPSAQVHDPDRHLALPDVLKLQRIFDEMASEKEREDKASDEAADRAAAHLKKKFPTKQFYTMSFADLKDAEKYG